MYDVLDVCRYLINYSNDKDYGVSNLKLQKLLYFVQAFFLINEKTSCPCFSDAIEAWDFGPVVPKAYKEYKQYGSSDIPKINSYIQYVDHNPWDFERIPYNNVIKVDDQKLMNAVVDKFAEYSATDLVTLTHKQSPWKDVYVSGEDNVITPESIVRYFNEGRN